MAELPYRPLAGFYFSYYAYLGAFAPFFSVYLLAVGRSPVEVGVLMALPGAARILAPHLWGWLADATGRPIALLRATTAAGALCFFGVFFGTGFSWLFAVLLLASFFLSAAMPLAEANTFAHLRGETGRYGRIRVWGSLGYIAAVVASGYAIDAFGARALPAAVAGLLLATFAFGCLTPQAPASPRPAETAPFARVAGRPEVLALIGACALMAAAHGPYYTFYSVHLVEHGYSKALTGWLWAFGVACEIGIFVWMPQLFRAFSAPQVLLASFALAVVRFLLIGWGVESFALLLFAQALHAATFGSFHAAAISLVHRMFRGRHEARGQAVFGSLSYGLGGTLGALASGYAWSHLGPALTFSLAALAALAGALLLRWQLVPRAQQLAGGSS
jgi:PPP family 3-phenylpropionic acid transporter